MQILSFGSFLSLATGSPAKFAIMYSLGNIVALAAYTCSNQHGLSDRFLEASGVHGRR